MVVLALAASPASADLGFALERANDTGFANPHDLVLASDGRHLYVADLGNHVVRVLDPASLELRGNIGQDEIYRLTGSGAATGTR